MADQNTLMLAYYGDDFTGSTDALEQLALAGVRAALFIAPPTPKQLARFKGLQAIGVAGMTRSFTPVAMERELRPALKKLKALGVRHVHYKVCSTFDSSPKIGSIGRAIDVGAEVFRAAFVPVLAAAPALGRYTLFGTHFARYGIGSAGAIHRLDRHPSISKHPVTPMTEADLRVHLGKQTKKRIALFDILKVALPQAEARAAFSRLLAEKPEIVLFDALSAQNLNAIGTLLEHYASARRPLFSVGSSGIEAALVADRKQQRPARTFARPAKQVLIGSGSCSPVTSGQIVWALKHGFAEVALNTAGLIADPTREIVRCSRMATAFLQAGRSVIVHTTKRGPNKQVAEKLKGSTLGTLGFALGAILRRALKGHAPVNRICLAGGDTSGHVASRLGVEALEMIAPLTPGAPLCRAHASPPSPMGGLEVVFKGGQVGPENFFEIVLKGKS